VKTTSSTKPKVHNVLHWCQRRTEPRPHVTCKTFVKFGHVVSQICERTEAQTDMLIAILRTPTAGDLMRQRIQMFIHSTMSSRSVKTEFFNHRLGKNTQSTIRQLGLFSPIIFMFNP